MNNDIEWVLRLKGVDGMGWDYYECTDTRVVNGIDEDYMSTGKFKYAETFPSEEKANDLKNRYPDGDLFEAVKTINGERPR